ncbi:uncharacterized protein LOC115788727 [Archocentrus centrarchus]|uniref:uncharacterized protein LOC115788727 n=1 Tax=Archocentrus centrarchus TaxID=63155 RepID=UPI0011E9FE47|nr:uncharacterized protein LOC115788727 [Archocentrus centrarchus]
MKVNIICCLLACVLGCNVTAGLTREVFKEKENAILPCPHSVKGKVLWSRESEGRKVDILTADGDRNEKHINDSGKRYNSQADGSLIILKASVSDSGRYLCNNEAAVELTVIPSGTMIHSVEERSNITLKCSHDVGESGVRKWSKDNAEIQQESIRVSTENQTLIIKAAELADTGLYYCDGKPAAYLNVTKGGRSDQENKRDLLLGIGVLVLILIILIIIIYITWRCRSNRRGNDKQGHVYEEIAAAELKVINAFFLRIWTQICRLRDRPSRHIRPK